MSQIPLLQDIDPRQDIAKKDYRKRLEAGQLAMVQLQDAIRELNIPVMLVLEGWDAAGKGGAIKRLVDRIDGRLFDIHQIAAPTKAEFAQHYLWRFWTRTPARGSIGIFDRSWYGRVLVERVEGFATNEEWGRAFREINEFEQQLADDGYLILKYFFHISKDEQAKRFEYRAKDPLKQWKLTDEDWRNREKWDAYVEATDDMLQKTHTEHAPWEVIAGDIKHHSRVTFAESVTGAIQRRVDQLRKNA